MHRDFVVKVSKSTRTKQFIIEKTAPVFNMKGYAGTSIADLMDATGLTKGSIYGNFENKDEVATAAFEYNFQCVINYIRQQMDAKSTIIDKLLVYPATYRNYFKLPFLMNGCPLANTGTEADDTHPALKQKAANALQLWRNSVQRQLEKGIELNEIKPETNIIEVVAVFTALIQGAALHAKISGQLQYLNSSMDYLEQLIKNLKV